MRGLVVLFAAAMFFAAAASGQVFHRCVDAEGKVTFSDRGWIGAEKYYDAILGKQVNR